MELVYELGDGYYTVVGLDEYEGTYGIIEGKTGNDGKHYPRWVYGQRYDPEKRENYPGDKAFPFRVTLPSDPALAVAALAEWADAIAVDNNIAFSYELGNEKAQSPSTGDGYRPPARNERPPRAARGGQPVQRRRREPIAAPPRAATRAPVPRTEVSDDDIPF